MEDIHSYDTRNKTMIPKNVTRTQCAQNSVRNELPFVLNNTDVMITAKFCTHSPQGFSNYVKNYFIENYVEHCQIQNCYICHN